MHPKYADFLTYAKRKYPDLLYPLIMLGEPKILNRKDAHLAAITKPRVRAGVTLNRKKPLFTFEIRRDVLERSTFEELIFVFIHELSHITYGHMDEIEEYENKEIFNVAADCIINDGLLRKDVGVPLAIAISNEWNFGLPPQIVGNGMRLCFGITNKKLGYDTSEMTLREVYDILIEGEPDEDESFQSFMDMLSDLFDILWSSGGSGGDPGEGEGSEGDGSQDGSNGSESGSGGDSEGDSDGSLSGKDRFNIKRGVSKAAEEALGEGKEPSELEKAIAGAIYKIFSPKEEKAEKTQSSAGLEHGELITHILQRKDSVKSWRILLRELRSEVRNRGRKRGPTWARRHKAAASLPENVKLRGMGKTYNQDKAKPFIMVYVDTSGSINDRFIDPVLERVSALPNETFAIISTFTTYIVPFDPDKGRHGNQIARGGTDFPPINQHLTTTIAEMGILPEAILIITDACFSGLSSPNLIKWDETVPKSLHRRTKLILIDSYITPAEGSFGYAGWDDFFQVNKQKYQFT